MNGAELAAAESSEERQEQQAQHTSMIEEEEEEEEEKEEEEEDGRGEGMRRRSSRNTCAESKVDGITMVDEEVSLLQSSSSSPTSPLTSSRNKSVQELVTSLGPLFMPDRASHLTLAPLLTFDDAPWISSVLKHGNKSIQLVHPTVDIAVSACLGCQSLREQLFAGEHIIYTLCTIHYTLYTIHYTLYTLHSTLYTIHYTLYNQRCT